MISLQTLLVLLSLAFLITAAPTDIQSLDARSPGEITARATGQFTWYYTGLGACGKVNSDGQLVAALNRATFDPKTPNGNPNRNTLCGRKIRLSYQGKSVDVTVVDRCAGCGPNDVDLSPAAFKRFAPLVKGRITGSWRWI
ncbi:RlpA-like double-psi beta-barrel-protein domain-containing protein-containing protein [Cladorrhinum samala]|uniref:RlpA-like double-psi beta-barrel-protein domain-containing protein-containing protein n=1 Tax=Cladorrhinum samala TaxID=585594 RepID=A0AAV9HHS6_9PEZI|nr:RlpA-like double-psi beta-barrel-protein domain-containing protein-containing protein [Cladorrhinum samala]